MERVKIAVEGINLEHVRDLKYLGCRISSVEVNGGLEDDIIMGYEETSEQTIEHSDQLRDFVVCFQKQA
jgi:hypothetical protein